MEKGIGFKENLVLGAIVVFLAIFFQIVGINPFFVLPLVFVGIYFLYYTPQTLSFREILFQLFLLCAGFVFFYLGYKFLIPRFNISVSFLPVMAIGMLSCLLFDNILLAGILVFLLSLFCAFLTHYFELFLVLFVPALASVLCVYKARRRTQIVRAAIFASVLQLLLDVFINLPVDFTLEELRTFFYSDIGNGIFSFILVSGFLPVLEHIFGVVTNIRLLELSDFNHPLLRRMILEAPGTYQHSILVANLAEVAAESIGANSLLCRVGAYFHDIGKINRAEYFVENRLHTADKHRIINPTMSRLVIINHVKEGVELATRYRLPPPIIDFIPQHHGTGLISYFYHQATKDLSQEEKEKLKDEFRYPGPKPQTKEAGIVLLADSVEAASRVLEEPSPSRIKELVDQIVSEKIDDGQLDETDLTLRDLKTVKEVFTRIITAIYHARIEYPQDTHNGNRSS